MLPLASLSKLPFVPIGVIMALLSLIPNFLSVAPGFKNKTRYTPYVSLGSQFSHIAINKENIKVHRARVFIASSKP